jgi:transposase
MINRDETCNRLRRSRITGRKTSRDRQIKAMKLYLESNATSKQIAENFGVSPSTLTVWVKNLDVALRDRGRRRLEEPTSVQKQILRQVWHQTYETVARSFGKKKQSIGRLVKHWWTWAEHEFGPRRISQGPKSESVRTPHTAAPKPDVRSVVVSFRLTAWQTDRVREILSVSGFGNHLSSSAACRAVLLAAAGINRFELPKKRSAVGRRTDCKQELTTEGSTKGVLPN